MWGMSLPAPEERLRPVDDSEEAIEVEVGRGLALADDMKDH